MGNNNPQIKITHYSLLIINYSLLITHYSLLIINYKLFITKLLLSTILGFFFRRV